MPDDIEFIQNYRNNHLYVHPGRTGAYATIAGESEEILAEIDVTARCKLAVSAFYVSDRSDFGTFKITKLQYHKRFGWRLDGSIHVNHFQLSQIRDFLSVISSLNLGDARKARVSLDNVNLDALEGLLRSTKGAELIKKLSVSPELHQDIYALTAKKAALSTFRERLDASSASEPEWQRFFEENTWIFGLGLNYVFLDKAGVKLESATTGSTFDRAGKRVDALMVTRAEVSQYVLVEIKKDSTKLLEGSTYRPGCWSVSADVSDAVTQIQKTAFEFAQDRFRNEVKDASGGNTGRVIYTIEPKSFLVVGNTLEIKENDDKITCFELYRRNIRAPEIITFDELFYRAEWIVQNLSGETNRRGAAEVDIDG